MSYEELAKARGISRLAAERLVQRHKWSRQRGNDGTARVCVPVAELVPPPRRPRRPNDGGDDTPVKLRAAEARAEAAETELDAMKAEAARLAAELVEQRERRVAAEAELAGFKAGLQVGELRALLETAKAQAAQSFWARVVALLPKPKG